MRSRLLAVVVFALTLSPIGQQHSFTMPSSSALPLGAPPQAHIAPLVDHHQHLFSPAATKLAPNIQPVSAADLIVLLDSAGIRRAVVLSLAYQFGNPNRPTIANEYEAVKAENDWTSQQVLLFPGRLRGFCSVNPLKAYALEEIARCTKDVGLRTGLKMHFGNSDVDLNDQKAVEQLRHVFRAANDAGMAIVIHMRSSVTRKRPYGVTEATIFLNQVLPMAPDVPVQIAHLTGAGGYDDPAIDQALGVFVGAISKRDARMANVYFDVSGIVGLGEWETKMGRVAARIRELGVTRILYGTDGAGGGTTPHEGWAAFRKLPLTDAEFRTIAGNTAPYLQ